MSDDSDVEVRVGIDAAGAEAGSSETVASLKQIEAALAQLNATTKSGTAEMSSAFRGMASQLQAAASQTRSSMGQMANDVDKAAGSMERGAHSATGLRRELIVMAHEASNGNFSRLGGSVLVLAERWEALGALLANPVTWAFAAVAAGVAGLIGLSSQAAEEEVKLANTLQLTGNYAGITATQFHEMAAQVGGQTTTSAGQARNVLMQLAASGRFTGDEIQQLGEVTIRFSQMSGEATDKVAQRWVKLADSPSKYAEEFSRQFHGAISEAQLEHIEQLERQGDKEGALAAAVQDLSGWIRGQTEAVTGITEHFREWGQWIGNVTDQLTLMMHLRGGTTGEQLAQVNAQMEQAQRLAQTAEGRRSLGGSDAGAARYIESLREQQEQLKGLEAADRAAATAQAEHNRVQQAGIDAYDKSHQTMLRLRSSAEEAAEAVKDLNAQMTARRAANPGDSEANDYFAHQQKYDDALRRKVDRADNKPGADQVQQWTEQLQQMEVASGDFFNDQTQMELKFWEGKLATVSSKSKEYATIQAKIYEDEKKLAHDAYDAVIEADRAKLADAKGNVEETQAAIDKYLSDVGAKYHRDSKEYEAAQKEATAALKAALQDRAKAQQQADDEALRNTIKTADASFESTKGEIEGEEQLVTEKERLGETNAERAAEQQAQLHQRLYAAEVDHQNQIYALTVEELQKELAIADLSPAEHRAIYKKIEEAYASHLDTMAKLAATNDKTIARDQATTAEAAQRAWLVPLQQIGNEFTSMTVGMITHSGNLRQSINRIGNQILSDSIGWIVKEGERWAAKELAKTGVFTAQEAIRKALGLANATTGVATDKLAAMSDITNSAARAGAAAFASTAAIPIIGPELAPAAGAAADMAAMMYAGQLASAAGGWGNIPEDQIAQVHKNEMILPASIASPLRSALGDGTFGAGGLGAPGGGGGDTHIHNWQLQAMDGKDVQAFFDKHSDKLVRTLKGATRRGAKVGGG